MVIKNRINKKELATFVRLARINSGLTQKQVAEEFGVTTACISYYESGTHYIPLDYILYFADVTLTPRS